MIFYQGPIRSPHHAPRTESIVQPLNLRLRVWIWIGLPRKRPGVRNLYEYLVVSLQGDEFFQLFGAIERTVSHVIDDYGERREFLDQRGYVRHPRDGRQDCHGDLEG